MRAQRRLPPGANSAARLALTPAPSPGYQSPLDRHGFLARRAPR